MGAVGCAQEQIAHLPWPGQLYRFRPRMESGISKHESTLALKNPTADWWVGDELPIGTAHSMTILPPKLGTVVKRLGIDWPRGLGVSGRGTSCPGWIRLKKIAQNCRQSDRCRFLSSNRRGITPEIKRR